MSGDDDFRVEQVEALARGLTQSNLEDAIKRTLEKLSGVPKEALEGVLRANESQAVTRALVLDAATLKTLPGDTLDALASTLFDFAVETTPEAPPPTEAEAKQPSGNTTSAFTGEVWTPDASYPNSFRGFYEMNGTLSREAFLSKYSAPFLVSRVTFDRATWSGALVLSVEKKNPKDADKNVSVGRDPACDLVIPHNSVSKQHLKFVLQDGRWSALDPGSANGTKIDDVTIEPNKAVRLRDISKIDLGGGANLTFNTPAGLYHLIEQIRKLESHNRAAARPVAPTADGPVMPANMVPSRAAQAKAATNKFSLEKHPTPAPKAKSERIAPPPPQPVESKAREALGGIASLIGTPQRVILTVVMVSLLGFAGSRTWKPLALMLFAEYLPEWFEKDLPDHLKNPQPQPPPAVTKPPEPPKK